MYFPRTWLNKKQLKSKIQSTLYSPSFTAKNHSFIWLNIIPPPWQIWGFIVLSFTTKVHGKIPCRFLRKATGCRSGFGSQSGSSLRVKRSYFSFSFSLAISSTKKGTVLVLDATLLIPACLPSSPWGSSASSATVAGTGPDPLRSLSDGRPTFIIFFYVKGMFFLFNG